MARSHASATREGLGWRPSLGRAFPDPLPADPVAILSGWLDEAAGVVEGDFNAMVLATATPGGMPSARVVLCKQIESTPPAAVFYTNYGSRKGRELEANPRAAGVFYWPSLKRQGRIEGTVIRTTVKESDEYFLSRPLLSRVGAIASRQSAPLTSRAALAARVMRTAMRPGAAGHRPAEWGGYRVLLDRIELWSASNGRLHDRAAWTLVPRSNPPVWTSTRLFP